MSLHIIYYDSGAKKMRPITTESEYRALRNSPRQQATVAAVRRGDREQKRRLLQFNYSCLPNPDGTLKGSTLRSNSVGMDVDILQAEGETDDHYRQRLAAIPAQVLAKKEELGLLMLERSATKGYHLVFRRRPGLTQEGNLRWASDLLGVEFDPGAKDITRVFFATSASTEDLIYLSEELFEQGTALQAAVESGDVNPAAPAVQPVTNPSGVMASSHEETYLGIPYAQIIKKWWELYNDGQEPCPGNRNTLTFELAVNLRHICGFDRDLLNRVIPDYWEGPSPLKGGQRGSEKLACIDSALAEKRTQMPRRLRDVLTELKKQLLRTAAPAQAETILTALEEAEQEDDLYYYRRIPQAALPQGIADSIRATGPKMIMPVLAASCPAIGALATDVSVIIHGKPTKLNMHSFVVGDAASCKGDLDPIVETWMAEEIEKNTLFHQQEDEYRAKKNAAKNAKQQPVEPHLPVRFLTMNNTVPKLAERLANTEGRHGFSYTPEADTVALRWRATMSDFSTMLRQSYDGSRYDREAKSAEATTVHIDHLYWNVCMCGTPDALYRVISNYTDGLLSRFIIAHTPDNTFAPLDATPCLMTDHLRQRIVQVAHLLPYMQGTLDLPQLEERSRQWVEKVRRAALKDDDRVMARARLRDHGTAMRMTVCLILCAIAERLISQHGLAGAERQLKVHPDLTAQMALSLQTPAMLDAYEVIAESLIDNDMLYFRDKLESATQANQIGATGTRRHSGKNDRIYDRLPAIFTFDQAQLAKGGEHSTNSVRQMLKNWKRQGLILPLDSRRYQKTEKESFSE